MAATATARIVVMTTMQEKEAIQAKAKQYKLTVSELILLSASTYTSEETDDALHLLADETKAAIDRASHSIEETLAFIEASNQRINAMQKKAAPTI